MSPHFLDQFEVQTYLYVHLNKCGFAFQAGLTVRAVQKYLLGTDMTLFTTEHLDGNQPIQPYPTVPGTETSDAYQSPPFTEKPDSNAPTYQVPIY